jgi:hypothetical protein
MATAGDDSASIITIDPSELDDLRANVFKSQIATYRLLARNLPVSDSLLQSCSYKAQLANLIQNHFQQQSQTTQPTTIVLGLHQNDSQKSLTFPSATNMYRWLVGSNDGHEDSTPTRSRQHPIGLNPLYIQQEREKRYEYKSSEISIKTFFSRSFSVLNRVSNRLQELEQMPAQMSVDLRTQALIELKSLKLLQFQRQLRGEILNTMKVFIFIFKNFFFNFFFFVFFNRKIH